jgi:hypothetical protein
LQADQAEADKKIAQAKAEERRVMAIAREQEMKAYVQEMRAKVVEAEAQVPLAMAVALRDGPHRRDGLRQPAQRPGRHRDAQRHRPHGPVRNVRLVANGSNGAGTGVSYRHMRGQSTMGLMDDLRRELEKAAADASGRVRRPGKTAARRNRSVPTTLFPRPRCRCRPPSASPS